MAWHQEFPHQDPRNFLELHCCTPKHVLLRERSQAENPDPSFIKSKDELVAFYKDIASRLGQENQGGSTNPMSNFQWLWQHLLAQHPMEFPHAKTLATVSACEVPNRVHRRSLRPGQVEDGCMARRWESFIDLYWFMEYTFLYFKHLQTFSKLPVVGMWNTWGSADQINSLDIDGSDT